MKKRVSTLLLALLLCITMFPTIAMAESIADLSLTDVDSDGNLTLTASSYKLTDNIVISSALKVSGNVTLDLNGYVLKITGSNNTVQIDTDSTLTINDGNEANQTHFFTSNYDAYYANASSAGINYKQVTGGAITGNIHIDTSSSSSDNNRGILTMNGGSIVTGNKVALTNSHLNINNSSYIDAGTISMDIFSSIALNSTNQKGAIINTVNDTGLAGLSDFLPAGFTIGTYNTYKTILNNTNSPATNITLYKAPEIPFSIDIDGSSAPNKTFNLEIFSSDDRTLTTSLAGISASVDTSGEGIYNSKITFNNLPAKLDDILNLFKEGGVPSYWNGIYVRQLNDGENGWTYDETVYYVTMTPLPASQGGAVAYSLLDSNISNSNVPAYGIYIYSTTSETDGENTYFDFNPYNSTSFAGITFENTYSSSNNNDNSNKNHKTPSYIIKATADDNGSISPDGDVKVRRGRDKTFTITPDNGYTVSKVLVDGKNIGAVETYTFNDVREAHTIQAYFANTTSGAITPIVPNPPKDLNSEEHNAYIDGYPDGTIMPETPITRAEAATLFYRLLIEESLAEIGTTAHNFTDISNKAWYREAAATMANGGYILGYPDNTFRGSQNITRAEFAAILTRFSGMQDNAVCNFSDVSEKHWAYDYIASAVAYGWINGDPAGTFRPDDFVTRAEAITMINRALNRGVNADSKLLNFKTFSDNTAGKWYYYEIIEASNGHDYNGTRPNENWSKIF